MYVYLLLRAHWVQTVLWDNRSLCCPVPECQADLCVWRGDTMGGEGPTTGWNEPQQDHHRDTCRSPVMPDAWVIFINAQCSKTFCNKNNMRSHWTSPGYPFIMCSVFCLVKITLNGEHHWLSLMMLHTDWNCTERVGDRESGGVRRRRRDQRLVCSAVIFLFIEMSYRILPRPEPFMTD